MRHLIATAPTRIDFGGGWTDVPPYSEEEGGCVCNVAISRYCVVNLSACPRDTDELTPPARDSDGALVHAALRRAQVRGVRTELSSDFPLGAGLGGSSAAGVALSGALAVWRGEVLAHHALAEASRRLEVEDLGVAGGRQDHYAAAFGGALGLWFSEETRVHRIALSSTVRHALERQCTIVYTGQSRISADTITAVLDAYRARTRRVVNALARMKTLAAEMIRALEAGNLDALAALVEEHWVEQRSLHPAIPTPRIDAILARAQAAGATGKALGASGGGCVIIIAPEDGAERVRKLVESMGQPLSFHIDEQGFRCESFG
jgi:D-glycero-alpha-D-manno-heptose-7-phosphate kinase